MAKRRPLTDAEFKARATEIWDQEKERPIEWYWVSFAGESGSLGVCIVPARGILSATRVAGALGLNPGGDVIAAPIPDYLFIHVNSHALRLLAPAEARVLDDLLAESAKLKEEEEEEEEENGDNHA